MEMLAIIIALLAGWAVRKKAADILRIRKTNQAHRRTLRKIARQASCWSQVQAVSGDYTEAVRSGRSVRCR